MKRSSQMPKRPNAPPDWIIGTMFGLGAIVAALWIASLLIAAGDQAGVAAGAVFHVMLGTR